MLCIIYTAIPEHQVLGKRFQQDKLTVYENIDYYGNLTQLGVSEILIYQHQATIANNSWADAYNDVLEYAGYIVVQATSTTNRLSTSYNY